MENILGRKSRILESGCQVHFPYTVYHNTMYPRLPLQWKAKCARSELPTLHRQQVNLRGWATKTQNIYSYVAKGFAPPPPWGRGVRHTYVYCMLRPLSAGYKAFYHLAVSRVLVGHEGFGWIFSIQAVNGDGSRSWGRTSPSSRAFEPCFEHTVLQYPRSFVAHKFCYILQYTGIQKNIWPLAISQNAGYNNMTWGQSIHD